MPPGPGRGRQEDGRRATGRSATRRRRPVRRPGAGIGESGLRGHGAYGTLSEYRWQVTSEWRGAPVSHPTRGRPRLKVRRAVGDGLSAGRSPGSGLWCALIGDRARQEGRIPHSISSGKALREAQARLSAPLRCARSLVLAVRVREPGTATAYASATTLSPEHAYSTQAGRPPGAEIASRLGVDLNVECEAAVA